MNEQLKTLQSLVKALEAGNYGATPGSLTQGAALQTEDMSPVMQNVTFQDKDMILQKQVDVQPCKSMLWQFNRQLSYGTFGGSAQLEGHVGDEETGDYVRVTVPMAFYAHVRRVTDASLMVETFDGVKADEREAKNAAMKIAADVEFDLFRGLDDFSDGGVFNGAPYAVPPLPGVHGIGLQVRQSDAMRQAQDIMFAEYGTGESVVLTAGGTLTQSMIEDAHVRSVINHGNAELFLVDPKVLSTYNKITQGKERIILAGSPTEATGSDLRKQWVSGGTVEIKASKFLMGKVAPASSKRATPLNPSIVVASVTTAGVVTAFTAGEKYWYTATASNEKGGESGKATEQQATVAVTGDEITVTITPNGSGNKAKFFNIYRSAANGSKTAVKFLGRVRDSGSATTVFNDQGNKLPGFVTGYLLETETFEVRELAPFSRKKLAETELSQVEAFYRFCALACTQPRKNVIVDNLVG